LTYIFHEGFDISVIVVTVIDLEEASPNKLTPTIARHDMYYHPYDPDEKLIRAHFGDPTVNQQLEILAEGLEVDEMPPKDDKTSKPSYFHQVGEGTYVFEHTMIGRPRNDHLLLYHIVLPEYCYVDKYDFNNETEENIIIATRENRQTIDCIYGEGKNLMKRVGFKGPNKSKFNDIHNNFPKHYMKPRIGYIPW
jgi:hypothetical protein